MKVKTILISLLFFSLGCSERNDSEILGEKDLNKMLNILSSRYNELRMHNGKEVVYHYCDAANTEFRIFRSKNEYYLSLDLAQDGWVEKVIEFNILSTNNFHIKTVVVGNIKINANYYVKVDGPISYWNWERNDHVGPLNWYDDNEDRIKMVEWEYQYEGYALHKERSYYRAYREECPDPY